MALEYDLASSIWEHWKKTLGYEPRRLSFMDVMNLVRYALKECSKRGCDYQIIDFKAILDPSIGYYENKELLDDYFSQIAKGIEQEGAWEKNREEEEYRKSVLEEAQKLGILEEYEKQIASLEEQLREKPVEIVKTRITNAEVNHGIAEINRELDEFKTQLREFTRLYDMSRTILDLNALAEEVRLYKPKIVAKIEVAKEFKDKLVTAGRKEMWEVTKQIAEIGSVLKSFDNLLGEIQNKIKELKKEERRAKAIYLPRGAAAKKTKAPTPSLISQEEKAALVGYSTGNLKVKLLDHVYIVQSKDFAGKLPKDFALKELRKFVPNPTPETVKEYVDTKGGGTSTNSLGSYVLSLAYYSDLGVKPMFPISL